MRRRPEVVVITGASAGVGRAVARRFAREGAAVGLIARGEEGLEATAAEIVDLGGRAIALAADVADADAVEGAAAAVEEAFGPIDAWINAAMATIFAPFADITADEFRRATEVTYLGCVHGTMAALRRMVPRDRGIVVQVGSALSYRAIPLQAPYCGAKFAIRGFTDSIRSELIHDRSRVRLTMVQLPAVNTPQFDWARSKLPWRPRPVPPVFQPEVAADAIHFAAHANRREIFVAGPTWKAIFANRLVPGLLDRYLARSAYRGQMDREPARMPAFDNLFLPLPGDFGAHGRFDREAAPDSPMLRATMIGDAVIEAALAGFLVAILLGRRHPRPDPPSRAGGRARTAGGWKLVPLRRLP